MERISRRTFVVSAAGAMALGPGLVRAAATDDTPWAGERIVDCHFHQRPSVEAMIAHLDGAGVSSALVLAFDDLGERMAGLRRDHPGRFLGWARGGRLTDDAGSGVAGPATPEFDMTRAISVASRKQALRALSRAKATGWKGFAETAGPVEVDGPELQRLYALAAELGVPVMMHFQQSVVPGQPAYGIRGFSRIEAMLKAYPRTRFVCHSSDFWGNIDARFRDGGAYPRGQVTPGGLSDRLLADYPNIYGDLGAPSCLMQLARDVDFTTGFLHRHGGKLMFGSDCGCTDGRGGQGGQGGQGAPAPAGSATGPSGQIDATSANAMQLRMAAQGGLAGKCIARELLALAWRTTPRDLFRRLTWENARRVYRLDG